MTIKPKFAAFLPENELEAAELQAKNINTLSIASGNQKAISQETLIEISGLSPDPEQEKTRLKAEHDAALEEEKQKDPAGLF